MNPELIAKKLKELRMQKKKTLTEVSCETGVAVSALGNYENGIRIPRDEVKKVLANYYGASVDEIFFNPKVHE